MATRISRARYSYAQPSGGSRSAKPDPERLVSAWDTHDHGVLQVLAAHELDQFLKRVACGDHRVGRTIDRHDLALVARDLELASFHENSVPLSGARPSRFRQPVSGRRRSVRRDGSTSGRYESTRCSGRRCIGGESCSN